MPIDIKLTDFFSNFSHFSEYESASNLECDKIYHEFILF